MSRRLAIDWAVFTILLMAAYAGRGWLMAWLLQGHYRWTSLVLDVIGLALLIAVFRILDLGLRVLFRRLLDRWARKDAPAGDESESTRPPPAKGWRWLADGSRFVIVFAVAAPFLVTLAQLHPQRIACGQTPRDRGLEFEAIRK